MNLLLISNLYAPELVGGAERSTQALAEELVYRGHQVWVFTSGSLNEEYDLNGVQIVRVKSENLYSSFESHQPQSTWKKPIWHMLDSWNHSYHKALCTLIQTNEIELVHTQNLSGLGVGVWKTVNNLGLPLVHTLRDYYLTCPKNTLYKEGNICRKTCSSCKFVTHARKVASHYVNAVVGISQYILDKHLQLGFFNHVKSHCIYNGIKTPLTINLEETETENLFCFGYLGRIASEKGIEVLMRAAQETALPIKIFGKLDSSYARHLKKISQSDGIEFVGYTAP